MIAETYRDSDDSTESMWQAVLSRDAQAPFLYGVRSTGIYCRPTCPSRRPGRNQVTFFRAPDAAEQAGFRPCRRCRPRTDESRDPGVELVENACRAIEENLDGGVTLPELGKIVGASPYHLQRTFKRVMGVSPRQYADACRMRRFKSSVKTGGSVTEAVYDAGFGSTSRLYERAAEHLGMVPATYRQGGTGTIIRYTSMNCSLGRLLVAATDRGICFVCLGERDDDLEASLRLEFFAAEIERDDERLGGWVSPILDYLRGLQPHLDLPLDVQATAFQRRVWEELRAIPYGETRTYAQVAAAVGQPTAARAVGHACATNPVSLVIPCHRVVRSDGHLGGYRWGLNRKAELLAHEMGQADSEE